jgi:hypothetical protein
MKQKELDILLARLESTDPLAWTVRLSRLLSGKAESDKTDDSASLIWRGTATAFGDFVIEEYKQGKIPGATSPNKAHKIMCALYIRPDGTHMDPASVQQLVRARNESWKPKPLGPKRPR